MANKSLTNDLYKTLISIFDEYEIFKPDFDEQDRDNFKLEVLKSIKKTIRKHENAAIMKSITPARGKIKVAKYFPGKPQPQTEGYTNILIHTSPAGLGGPLSPYVLRNEHGQLLENIWQFSKVYEIVNALKTPLSRFHPDTIIWEHPREIHFKDGELTEDFWAWREKGMNNLYAVRYPNGFKGRTKCLFAVWPGNNDEEDVKLNYIEGRKRIYCGDQKPASL